MTRQWNWDFISALAINFALWGMIFIIIGKLT